jgi:hypothetical protein
MKQKGYCKEERYGSNHAPAHNVPTVAASLRI